MMEYVIFGGPCAKGEMEKCVEFYGPFTQYTEAFSTMVEKVKHNANPIGYRYMLKEIMHKDFWMDN
jgi:hypothetical protein